jgi:uncharacterized repeat protein (TIGR03806 family)
MAGAALLVLMAGCGRDVRTHLHGPFPEKLSAWRLFSGNPASLTPNRGVVPYDLNTTLFTDYATKRRFVWMPPGTAAEYRADDAFEFPKGAILSKTFSYPDADLGSRERLIETRLLVNTGQGWVALPYVWNAAQTEATLQIVARPVEVNWRKPSGGNYDIHYQVPNANQCKECHDRNKITKPIGPKARHLNREMTYPEGTFNQLVYWTKIGYLRSAPEPAKISKQAVWDDPSTGTLEARARAYLDVNCAHCHALDGAASNTGLFLSDLQKDPMRLGFCKTPVATGKASADMLFDAVPGHPDLSILAHRMSSIEPKIMMPEIGRTIVHKEGLQLIREWLASLRGGCEAGRANI